ncbi:transcription termination/antitermination protein NusA [Desulfoluna limicola]|uniref:Transcription termination/antitermination protein NusA n=1 Tax=Desulfoluna limicola TaxID=2810562 RepID=A0ABM7PK89_9BACT|nr:transcription termination factor NusA [Desulfoluna limicola]BCS97974.1 transcription termination/antitermination protein NusA [Desulfoluna limicola]
MQISEIKRVVEQVSKDKGIDFNVLIKTLEEALASAARKKLGKNADIEVQYNEESGEIEVFQFKEVVADVVDPDVEITIEEGRKLDSECEYGDSLGLKVDTSTFGRIAAQSAKQVIIQKMKDAEREAIYESFIDRKGEIINGIVQRVDRGDLIVNLGNTEAVLPVRDQIPREAFRRGDRVRALIKDVLLESRGPQVILTRASSEFLISLFKTEVPEIMEGVVKINGAARESGVRAKISVSSIDSDIDPVGACVGMKGSRVQNVVQELKGEKIDIIPWHPDSARYVCNALAPAEIAKVIIDEDTMTMEVIVPVDYLSVAIGKKGQNVRLASILTGWQLDVVSEEEHSRSLKDEFNTLMSIPGVGAAQAEALHSNGYYTVEDVAEASMDDLLEIDGFDEERATLVLNSARNPEPAVSSTEEDEPAADEEAASDITDEDVSVESEPEPLEADEADEEADSPEQESDPESNPDA